MSPRAKTKLRVPAKRPSKPKGKARIRKPDRFEDIAGCLSDEDAAEMRTIIEQSCEQVDPDAWHDLS